jgi:hypothetical protein
MSSTLRRYALVGFRRVLGASIMAYVDHSPTAMRPSACHRRNPSFVGFIVTLSSTAGLCLFIFSRHGDSAKWTCEGGATAAKAGIRKLT